MKIPVKREELFKLVGQENIMNRFFGQEVREGKMYKNPFRSVLGLKEDSSAGCFFKYSSSGVLLFYDLATDKNWFDCIDIAVLATGVKKPHIYDVIWDEVHKNNLNVIRDHSYENFVVKQKKVEPKDIRVMLTNFELSDYEYWNQFNINPMILNFFDVRKVKRVWIDKVLWKVSTEKQPIYRYKEKNRFKIYRPFADKKSKFRNNFGNYLDGWNQLPICGDVVLITSSRKDVMSLYSLGFTSVSPTAESRVISKNALNLLKSRFKFVIPYMNNDETGLKMTAKYEEVYGLKGIYNPLNEPKDPSDWIKKEKNDLEKIINYINGEIQKIMENAHTLSSDASERA